MPWILATQEASDIVSWLGNSRWANNVIHWFSNNPVLNPAMHKADFVECDPTNLSPDGISGLFTLPWRFPDGTIGMWFDLLLTTNGVSYPLVCKGWYMTDVTGNTIVGAAYFDNPLVFTDEFSAFAVEIMIGFPLSGR